jgi:cellulase/cellobiase CelA1
VWSNIAPATILTAFSRLVDQMRASNPAMKILVAKIIPMGTSQCTPCGQRVIDFNNAIPGWASGKTTAQSPITVVDQWTGFNTTTDTYDGVHPNATGDQKISDRWFSPLVSAINGVPTSPTGGPTSSPSVSPTPSASTPNPIPPLRCRATYAVLNQWQGAFQGEVTVTNITTATQMTSWSLSFNFANGQVITQMWNASYTQTGATVLARNASYNGSLAPGASTTFGFLANWSGTNSVPTLSCA